LTTVIFIRHGQSTANLACLFAGHTDVALTELGHKQAENTANFLKNYPISAIYSSDLERSMQTAAPTGKMHNLPVIPDRALREIFAGEWEGRAYEELLEKYTQSFNTWRFDCGRAHPEGGESTVELGTRIYREVDRLIEKHKGECFAIFTHATPIRLMRAKWEGYPPEELKNVEFCANASVSVVEYDDNGNTNVLLYGYDEHQGDIATRFAKGSI
jgi:broad specificity phosphatase PhoE